MAKRPPKEPNEFGDIENQWLLFLLHVIRQARLTFEAAAASRWVTYWIASMVLGVPAASWLIKTHFH